jgi:trehalose 6-phosphate phosphatase
MRALVQDKTSSDYIASLNGCGLFFETLAAATSRCLLLDYDGTVAPFTADRRRSFPYPSIPRLLESIMNTCNTRLIMVSGRAAREVAPLLGLSSAPETWGTHGLERLYPDGRYEGPAVSDETFATLAEAEESLEREGLKPLVEVKPGAVAVHWRGLSSIAESEVRAAAYRALKPLACQTGLLLREFDAGVEIRLREANKGDVVRTILAEIDSSVPVAYLGDDITDEDAFHALNGRGLAVLVRRTPRFTAAQLRLRPPQEVVQFLADWVRACGGVL